MHLSWLQFVPHAPLISFFFIWSPKQHFVSSADHKVPLYVFFSTAPYLVTLRSHIFLSTLFLNIVSQCERPSFTPIQNNRQKYFSVYCNLYFFGKQSSYEIFCAEWQEAFPEISLHLISSWIQFLSLRLYQNIWTSPHSQIIHYPPFLCDFVLHVCLQGMGVYAT